MIVIRLRIFEISSKKLTLLSKHNIKSDRSLQLIIFVMQICRFTFLLFSLVEIFAQFLLIKRLLALVINQFFNIDFKNWSVSMIIYWLRYWISEIRSFNFQHRQRAIYSSSFFFRLPLPLFLSHLTGAVLETFSQTTSRSLSEFLYFFKNGITLSCDRPEHFWLK